MFHRLYSDISIIGLRFFTVYGPQGRPDMAPYKFLNSIINNEEITQYGDGNSKRDYTYIDDIVDGVISALENKKQIKCEIINLGNSNPITLKQFINTCEKISNLVQENEIDEIAILTWCHNEKSRIKSYELFADAFQLSSYNKLAKA